MDDLTKEKPPKNILGISDEEFSSYNDPDEVNYDSEEKPTTSKKPTEEDIDDLSTDTSEEEVDEIESDDTETETKDEPESNELDDLDDEDEDESESEDDESDNSGEDVDKFSDTASKDAEDKTDEKDKSKAKDTAKADVDYKEFYTKIMTPFKANGKTIDLKSPDEAIQLMQMGANYTKKMQSIQPYRKVLLMLENNKLLDENELSYLIDLKQHDKSAIRKLLKESDVDPMDLDTDDENELEYTQGNHNVSDEEAAFVSAIDDVKTSSTGEQTLQLINDSWDQASKQALWEQPNLIGVINSQVDSGIYKSITDEIDRQRTLGTIPVDTPFLQAYKTIGDQLKNKGLLGNSKPVTRKVSKPKNSVSNNDRASAASPTRSSPKKAKTIVNPLAMSDDDFLKQMQNRL